MGYPDIPRTQGGDPYPIIWDDAQKKWVAWQGQVQLSGSFTALDTLNNKVATDVGLAALDATLQAIGVVVGDRATEATLESAKQALASLDGKVATAAKQDAAKGVLDAISAAVAARATEATLAAIKDALTDGTQKVQLSGSLLERYGPTVSERPAANTVPIGAVYMAVQTQQMWQSDGSQWVVM